MVSMAKTTATNKRMTTVHAMLKLAKPINMIVIIINDNDDNDNNQNNNKNKTNKMYITK